MFLSYYSIIIDTSYLLNKKGKEMAKGQKFQRTRGIIGRVFNLRAWGNADGWWGHALDLTDSIQRLFVPQAPTKKETLEIVMRRLKLSKEQVLAKQRNFLFLAIFSFLIAIGCFCYLIYLIIEGHLAALPLSVAVFAIALAFSFRYHFWYFQLKQGKLGCSVQEWAKGCFRRGA